MSKLTWISAIVVFALACGGGGEKPSSAGNTTSTATPSTATTPPASSTAKATTSAARTAAPIAGKTVDVQMIGDAKGYRYEPNNITIKVGDGLKFTNVSGGPHNVTFSPDSIPAGAQAQLQGNMPNTTAPLTGPLLVNPNDSYTISFAGVKPGTYHFYCTPHLALGMRGSVTVQ